MINIRPKITCFVLACLAVIVAAGVCIPVSGYVLQGAHLLHLMTQKLKASKTLHVSQYLIQHDTEPPLAFAKLSEQLYFEFPDRFRADSFIDTDALKRTLMVSGSRMLTVLDGYASDGPGQSLDLYKDILLFRSRVLLHKQLLQKGIDVSISSMGRYNDQPVFVIGAVYPDESVSQLLLQKDSFLPVRLMVVETPSEFSVTANHLDIRYEEWMEFDKIWYPLRVEIYRNGQLIREIMVRNVSVDAFISPDVLDIETVRQQFTATKHRLDIMDESDEGVTDVQKSIDDFTKKFE
ncbi:MAG: hypothetical protein HKM93_23915 [Desulfobacteraceae bacterium]|nr:hypothetical protein [Desulfobacteraceae bacterium]